MKRMRWTVCGALVAAISAAAAGPATASAGSMQHRHPSRAVDHVLLISVDGMHQSDLAWYVSHHPGSALARLVDSGTSFTNARTPFPSDSFPGLIGQVTGGNPRTTGIWYDVSYNHALLPPGTTNCASAARGTPVIDRTPKALAFARNYLLHYAGDGTGTDGHAKATGIDTTPKAYTAAGLRKVLVGRQVLAFTGARAGDPRVPDLIGIVQHGVVYTGGTKKIAEHGGDDPQDRHVPLVVSTPRGEGDVVDKRVSTVQIAPTILRLLRIDPRELKAVRIEHTRALPLS